jgi:hypothetical protein
MGILCHIYDTLMTELEMRVVAELEMRVVAEAVL